jgi:tetratricopeptide (TPR) repeat protein
MVGSLAYYWFRHGHGAEGIQMANAAFARADLHPVLEDENASRDQMMIRAKAFQAAAFLSYSQGDNPNARRAGNQCIALARQLGDIRMLAVALSFSSSARLFEGDFANARVEVEEAVAISRQAGERLGLGIALAMMAQFEMIANHNIQAAGQYEQQALALTRDIAGKWTNLMLYFGTGRSAMFRRDYEMARERFAYCLPLFEEIRDEHRVNMIHSEFAHMDRYQGNYQQAEKAYRKTILIWQKLGHRAAVAHQLECFAFIAKALEEPARALRLLGAAEILREKINIQMQPLERVEYESEVTGLRAMKSENEFKNYWAQGRALSMDEAVDLALHA